MVNNRRQSKTTKVLTKRAFVDMLNARREMKYTNGNDETTMLVNGGIGAMSQEITVGDTADLRDGNQVEIVKLDIILTAALNASATVDTIRFIFFADMQANSLAPGVTDVIFAADPNAAYTRNVTVTKRFKILHDVLIPLAINGPNRIITHRKSIKMNHVVTYTGTTNAEASNGRGAIYYLQVGDEGTNLTTYNLDWAFSFYDS